MLILKITYFDAVRGLLPVLSDLAKFGQYRCRVVLIHGMLPDEEYRALVRVTSYAVNASTNEGQCCRSWSSCRPDGPRWHPRIRRCWTI